MPRPWVTQIIVNALALLAAALVLSACGGSGGTSAPSISVGAARTFALDGFQPAGNLTAGSPTTVSFRIDQPSGQPLTQWCYFHHGGVRRLYSRMMCSLRMSMALPRK